MSSSKLFGSKTRLPGFGLPLDHVPKEEDLDQVSDFYPNALTGEIPLPPLTLREIAMMQLMNAITDKKDWHIKVFDKTITDKWETEAMLDETFTKKMTSWCIEELKFKAKQFEKTGFVSVFNGDVLKSDTVIPDALQVALQKAVKILEDVPAREKDWHPESDEQVLDLVHPSLYPLIYGRSRVLESGVTSLDDCIKRCNEGVVLVLPQEEQEIHSQTKEYSTNYQWLPCEVDITGDSARITTYINNLHPERHRDLYGIINQVLTRVVPMWSATLWPLRQEFDDWKLRIPYGECEYDEGPQQEDGESDDDYNKRREPWLAETRRLFPPLPATMTSFLLDVQEKTRRVVLPEPAMYLPTLASTVPSLKVKHTSLQVIVKLANIELTPEKPEYAGGSWHVEGQLNEHICATALYYYSCDNIDTSKLAFRQQGNPELLEDITYEQHYHDWVTPVFGLQPEGPAIQVVGGINTTAGRVITFPNVLQHQVQPFKLLDPSKPGHRKILAFFLVDPNIKVISTANVPCQQKSWWRDATVPSKPKGLDGTLPHTLEDLPVELQDNIFKDVDDFPITLEEAKEIRLKLMEERKAFVLNNTAAFLESVGISLCEH